MKEATVCHLLRRNGHGEEVLLGKRAELFSTGRWNGPGGKMWKRERILTNARRETRDEVGVELDLGSAVHFATVDFYHPFSDGTRHEWRVHFIRFTSWTGEPKPIGFSEIDWFVYANLPYEKMMADEKFWMPIALIESSRKLKLLGTVYYADLELKTISEMSFKFVAQT